MDDYTRYQEYYIEKDGIRLHAKMSFPELLQMKMPMVIVLHGLTGHMEEEHIRAAAQAAVEEGYAALRVELYGHGMSDGEFCDHNVAEWVEELSFVVDYAKSLDFVTDLYLAGHSQGGLTVMLTGAKKADCIRGILPLSPAANIVEGCRKGSLFGLEFDPEEIPEKLELWDDKYVTSGYAETGKKLPLEESIRDYKGEVLLIHGTKDETVPVSYGIEAAKGYENGTMVLIPGDDHCYNYHLDQVAAAIREFLRDQKKGSDNL